VVIGKFTSSSVRVSSKGASKGSKGSKGTKGRTDIITDKSTIIRRGDKNVSVDRVEVTLTERGERMVKVRMRDGSRPVGIGDKWTSRHGQKGVVGLLVSQEDMPFTGDGVVPDIMVNAHGYPSRMTIGELYEMAAGKCAALKGSRADGTAFRTNQDAQLFRDLIDADFAPSGKEVMYNPHTGEPFDDPVMIGLVSMCRLKHFAGDKVHSRARGAVQRISRQPVEGRAKDGGLRFGEMERDTLCAHGSSAVCRDRLCRVSDACNVPLCTGCGRIGVTVEHEEPPRRRMHCTYCQNSLTTGLIEPHEVKEVKEVEMTMAALQLREELAMANVDLKFFP